MSGRISDYQVEQWLAALQDSTFMALHTDNPDVAGAYASELFGGGYVRQKVTLTAPANRASWNAGVVTFSGLPAATITHIGGWNALINGDLRFSIALPAPLRVTAGSTRSFPAQMLAISLD